MKSNAVIAFIVLALLTGCARPKVHVAPDRAKYVAAKVRVERAIPVVRESHRKLIATAKLNAENYTATREAYDAQTAIIDALPAHLERLRTSATDVDLRAELDALDSTIQQLRASTLTIATQFRSGEVDLRRFDEDLKAHGAAIASLEGGLAEMKKEGESVFAAYETKLVRLNELEPLYADTKNENTKLKIKSALKDTWAVISTLGTGVVALLFAFGKLGLK